MSEFGRRVARPSSNDSWSPSHQTRWVGFLQATASRANDSNGADSGVGRSSYSSRDSHKDWGSTAPVGILPWVDHFEPWQT
jgi:hypothetical protein